MRGICRLTSGSTNYAFKLAGDVVVGVKPRTGEVIRQTGVLSRSDILDNPWHISSFTGLGTSHSDTDISVGADTDNRFFEGKNIQHWPGMWCMGPLANTTTDVTGTRRVIGFTQFRNNLFSFADVAGTTSTETIQYWQTTGTWTDCTAVADFNATVAGSGFPTVGMVDQDGRVYALRTVFVAPGAHYQLIYSTDGTTWTLIDHVNAADCPGPSTSYNCVGLVSLLGVMYTATLDSSSRILLRQNAAGNNGVTWTTTATSTDSVSAINGIIVRPYFGVYRIHVLTPEGVYIWNGTNFFRAIEHVNRFGENETNTGKNPIWWSVNGVEDGWLVYPQGRQIRLIAGGTYNTGERQSIAPTTNTQGLPGFRDGQVTAFAANPDFLFAAIGGDSSSTTAGVYVRRAEFLHPLGWFGPIYDVGTANRQIRAMFLSSYNDGIVRLHIAVDNGTANDTDLLYFDNVTSDPRTVSSYKHCSSATLILPKNDRDLSELNGVWRKLEFTGTNFTSNNKVSAIYAVADSAPIASDSGAWGSTLGAVTSSGGTVNFSATPTGSGQSAKAIQVRIDLAGTSNQSPYIETMNIYVSKQVVIKYIRKLTLDLRGRGTVQSGAKLRTDIETILSSTTDLQVVVSDRAATIMEPYWTGGSPLRYLDSPDKPGTTNSHLGTKFAELTVVDV